MQRYINNSLLQEKSTFILGIVVREATPRPKGWRVFCREVEFFWDGARAGRMTALA